MFQARPRGSDMTAGQPDPGLHRPAESMRAGRKALDVARLCTLTRLPDDTLAEIDPALTALLHRAEAAVRTQVAVHLADCSWAPREAVRLLAFDTVEIAQPILARSPRLNDADLTDAAGRGREHRRIIAGRARLSAPVVAALTGFREIESLKIIASNPGAELGPASASDFAACARTDPELQDRLADRLDMHPAVARAVYAVAGQRVKDLLAAAVPELDPGRVDEAVEDGLEAALDEGEDTAAAALVSRLIGRNALTKADVLRAAHGGRSDICDHAVARLTGLHASDWRKALSRSPLRATMLAARTMAMTTDEAASLYAAFAAFGRGHELAPQALAQACGEVYATFTRDDARRALHRLGAGASLH